MTKKPLKMDAANIKRRERYARNPSKINAANSQWKREHREQESIRLKKWRGANPNITPQYSRNARKRVRQETFAAYGGMCVCCGEQILGFLTIDHIFDDGAKHREEIGLKGKSGTPLYRWLRSQKFPKDRYQILCFNCNCGRARNGGICPHQENKSNAPL